MEFKKGINRLSKNKTLKYSLLAIIGILIIFLVSYYAGVFKENCKNDIHCFDSLASICKPAKVDVIKNNNLYEYFVVGPRTDGCKIKISLPRMAVGTDVFLRSKFEGKSMDCIIPLHVLSQKSINEMTDILNYCNGPLKTAMLELIVERMYSYIVKNLDSIVLVVNQTKPLDLV